MFKNLPIRIIAIIMVLGLIALGSFAFVVLKQEGAINSPKELIEKTKQIMILFMVSYFVISVFIVFLANKMSSNPLNKLIESAEQKVKEENLEMTRQKKQIETILLHMTDGIIAFNIEGNIIHINPAAMRLLNINEYDNTFDKIFSKIKLNVNMEKIIYLEEWATTVERINIDDRYMNLFFAPFKDENERPAGVLVVVQDITEHVKLDNMRKEFIADVSHELKTPITSIMGYAETLATTDYDKDLQEKFLNVIINESVRMTKLVSDLLTLSKHDNAETRWEKTKFDLGDLVKKCQEKLQIEIDKKEQKVECMVTANVPPVCADKDGIERVVLNILSNSIKYTEKGGIIKIYVGFLYNDAYIKIIDNGIGIPEKDLGRIFDRFYRVDKTRSRELGGTGLRTINSKRNPRQKRRKNRYKKHSA